MYDFLLEYIPEFLEDEELSAEQIKEIADIVYDTDYIWEAIDNCIEFALNEVKK